MATSTRTSPAKRTTPTRRTPAAAGADSTMPFEPIRITTPAEKAPEETIPLFYIDDVEYRIPKVIKPRFLFQFIRVQREHGDISAAQFVLERLLGPDAYKTFEQSDAITEEHMEQIAQMLVNHMAGPAEGLGKGRG